MKKIVSLLTAIALLLSFSQGVLAVRFDICDKFEAEALTVSKNQGEYAIIENSQFSGGKAVELTVEKNGDWLRNDYVRLMVPVHQKGLYNIKIGVKKAPDQGIMQLWFSDYNRRAGDKVDLYSANEEYTEVDLGNHVLDLQSSGRWFEFRVDGQNPSAKGDNINVDYIIIEMREVFHGDETNLPYLNDSAPVANGDEPYAWGQVIETGTGRTTHVVFHPTEKGLAYLGTDMGGMYRWNDDTYTWTPITDKFTADKMGFYIGIDGIALDPNNPDIVYAALGVNSDKGAKHIGAIAKSYDRGETWQVLRDAYFDANGDFRFTNEPIIVDPANSNVVWCLTMGPEVLKSTDGGKTWNELSIPSEMVKNQVPPRVVAIDESTKTPNGCTRVYISVYNDGVYVTNDGGETWEKLAFDSKQVTQIEYSNDGTMAFATMDFGLWTLKNGVWKNISPDKNNVKWTEVAISRTNSNYMITSWYKGPVGSYGQYCYYTLDGGDTWRMFSDDVIKMHQAPRIEYGSFFANVADIDIDPHNEKRVFMGGWQNFYMTDDIFAENPVWGNYTRGIEHGCISNMISLPVGARLMVASHDYKGSRFIDVTQVPDIMLPPKEGTPPKTAFSEGNPNFVVRTSAKVIVYSTDNGLNWRNFASVPAEFAGTRITDVAISTEVYPETGKYAVLVCAPGFAPCVTFDYGETWVKSNGPEMFGGEWLRNKFLAADSKSGGIFYAYAKDGALYRSDDFGVNFSKITQFGESLAKNSDVLRTSFGKNAGVFVSSEGKLFRSTTKGELFKEIGDFTTITDFAFGKEKDENSPATIYVWGTREGILGVHRSTDNGETWINIHNDATAKEKLVTTMVMCADRQAFGVVYVASSGRGIKYGVPRDAENPFYVCRDDAIKVMINTQLVNFDVEPQLINDRTMVPMRKIFENVGAKVEWDEATQTVTATRLVSDNWGIEETTVQLTIGSNKIKINGVEKEMDVAPIVINDRTLVPVRFISEALGAKVDWIDEKQLVKITP